MASVAHVVDAVTVELVSGMAVLTALVLPLAELAGLAVQPASATTLRAVSEGGEHPGSAPPPGWTPHRPGDATDLAGQLAHKGGSLPALPLPGSELRITRV